MNEETTSPSSPGSLADSVSVPAIRLELSINSTSSRAEVLGTVTKLCSLLQASEVSWKRLGFILGHVLAIVQERKLYTPEYPSFEDYRLAIAEKYSLSRSNVSNWLAVAKALPDLDSAAAQAIPGANLTLVSRVAKHSPKKASGLLAEAAATPIVEFRQRLEKKGLIRPKAPGKLKLRGKFVLLKILVPRAVAGEWQKLVGNSDPSKVFVELLRGSKQSQAA